MPMSRISVVIPVLNEAETIAGCLEEFVRSPDTFEVVVVDGGSSDGTPDLVRQVPGVRLVISGRQGRAVQMNQGAAASTGDALLFLHADTRLPRRAGSLILAALDDPRVVGGRFRLRVSGGRPVYYWIGLLSTCRSRCLNTTYGDQAIFVRRWVYDRVNGFPDIPLFEDSEFCRTVSRLGRFVMLEEDAVTSSRRWERCGVWRTILLMWMLEILHCLSVSPERLAGYYRNIR